MLELCASIFVFADSELLFDFTTTLLLLDELVACTELIEEAIAQTDIQAKPCPPRR
ncbi:hypothetical protein BCE02nite_43800 [Brevibacillus centrosporus]|nr:hypothetical protein BCE02nite_43800 [Brevibacillus centrosporus]